MRAPNIKLARRAGIVAAVAAASVTAAVITAALAQAASIADVKVVLVQTLDGTNEKKDVLILQNTAASGSVSIDGAEVYSENSSGTDTLIYTVGDVADLAPGAKYSIGGSDFDGFAPTVTLSTTFTTGVMPREGGVYFKTGGTFRAGFATHTGATTALNGGSTVDTPTPSPYMPLLHERVGFGGDYRRDFALQEPTW